MHPTTVTRRHFLTLSGAALASVTAGYPRLARACPAINVPPADTASAINAFAADLHGRLAKDEKGALCFSPFSISTALAMTAAGAAGDTLAEMEKVLHLPNNPHAGFGELLAHLGGSQERKRPYQLSVANALWAKTGYPWRKEYIELTRKHYGAGVTETDFLNPEPARKTINAWVAKETKSKIKDLIGAGVLTPLTVLVLTNAIHFKGDWQTRFEKKDTQNAPFTRLDGTKSEVPLMQQTGGFGYGEFTMFVRRAGEKVRVLELPYSGRELSMLLYLPEDPTGVKRLPEWLRGDDYARPELREQKVRVSLPRFSAASGFSLKRPLMDLGMVAAFTDGKADFSGMHSGKGEPYVSHVLHKAFVDVNEEGTEAAAATAVVLTERASAPEEPIEFRADRPFVFTIRENKTGATLFLGRYVGQA